jgi:hypothetical protein
MAHVKIELTENGQDFDIEGNGVMCLSLLVNLFYENPEIKKLFEDALKATELYKTTLRSKETENQKSN